MIDKKLESKNRLKNIFPEEKQEGIYSKEEYIDKPEAILSCGLGKRTLDYFIDTKILKAGVRLSNSPNHKVKYWKREYLIGEIEAIKELQDKYDQSVGQIRILAKATRYNLKKLVDCLETLVEEAIRRLRRDFDYPGEIKMEVSCNFLGLVSADKIKTDKDIKLFEYELDMFITGYLGRIRRAENDYNPEIKGALRKDEYKSYTLRTMSDDFRRDFIKEKDKQ